MAFDWNTPKLVSPSSKFYPWLILLNVILATAPTAITGTAGFVSDASIRGTLMLGVSESQWIDISYIMMLGLVLPLAVWLAEKYGYKRIFFISIFIFALASLLNGLATGFLSFLLSRILAGAGAGAILPLGLSLIAQVFPKEKLALPIAIYVSACLGFASSLGFALGGYFAEYLSWKDSFFLCFGLSLMPLILTPLLQQETPRKKEMLFDSLGFTAFILFLSSVLIILNSGKAPWNTDGWGSAFIWSFALIGLIGFICLIRIESRHSSPILILALFKNHAFLLGVAAIFFIGASYYATQILFTSLLDQVYHYEKYTVGLFLASACATMGIVSALAGLLANRINIRWFALTGLGLVMISCWMNQYLSLYSDHLQILLMMHLRMIGAGVCLGPLTAFALSGVSKDHSSGASLLATFFRQMGGTLGSVGAASVIVTRQTFHNEMYGSQMDTASPCVPAHLS